MIAGVAVFFRFVLHDLRLTARGLASMFSATSPVNLGALIAVLLVSLHAAAWPIAGWLVGIEDGPDGAARITMILAGGSALAVPWIIAQSMTALTRTLFGRSDLELLLSSPINPRSLLAARAFSIAIDAAVSVGLLLAPLANIAALRGHPHWLALYPALIAAGLMGTAIGVVLAMGLFLAVGPRRARLLCQIAATMVGASFVLGAQAVAMLPDRIRTGVLAIFAPPVRRVGALQGLVWTPIRAAAGDPSAMLVWAVFGVAAFVFACTLFGERFAQAVVVATGAPDGAGGSTNRTTRFGGSVGAAVRAKERRVVWRDPWLMSQLLLQAAYTTPVAVILWRSGGPTGTVGVAFTPALVVIAAQLAGALSWIALSAEDAPDFLATAPVARTAIERGKIAADRPADRAHPRPAPSRARLCLSLGRAMCASIRRWSDRFLSAGQSLETSAVPSRPGSASSFAVEARRTDGAPGLDSLGGFGGDCCHWLMGGGRPSGRRGGHVGDQLEVGGSSFAGAFLMARPHRVPSGLVRDVSAPLV